jgi:ABC-2 type transport system permease protein
MILTLYKLNLKALLSGILWTRGGKTPGKVKMILLAALYIYIAASLTFAFGVLFYALLEPFYAAGVGWMYFALFAAGSFSFGVLGTIFIASAQLFGAKDNETLLAMPVKPAHILISRIAVLLTFEYVSSPVLYLPAAFLWLRSGHGSAGGMALFIVGFLLLPLLVISVSLLLAWLLSAFGGGKTRGKNILTLILSVGFLLAYLYGYTNLQRYLGELVTRGGEIAEAFRKAAPPFYAFGTAVAGANPVQAAIFALWALAAFGAVYALLSARYLKILTTNRGTVKVKYREKKAKVSGLAAALVKKELAHYWNCPAVVLNTSLGSIFALIGAAALIAKKADILAYLEPVWAMAPWLPLPALAAFAVMTLGTVNSLSSSLISLEGKYLWITQCAPVPPATVLFSKVCAHMLVSSLPCLAASVAASAVIADGAADWLTVVVIPQTFCALTAFGGVALNLTFPRLDWISETHVVKRSASALLSMYGSLGLLAGLALLYAFPLRSALPLEVYMWLFAAGAAAVFAYLRKGGAARFEKL